ncbi:MAG: hypothetical protein ABIF40_04085 [archaeon]
MVKVRNILFSVLGGITAAIALNTADARPIINTKLDETLENLSTLQDPTLEEAEYLAYAENSMGGLIENYFNTPDATIPFFMTNILGPQKKEFAKPERYESDYYTFVTTLNEDNVTWVADTMDETFEEYADLTEAHHLAEKLYVSLPKNRDEFRQNRISPIIPDGLGGLTLTIGMGDMMFPFEGSYGDLYHVGRHEGWHQFQVEVVPNAASFKGNLISPNSLPLLLIEGQAEYFSEGWDAKKQMVVKDLYLNNSASLFTVENLNQALYGSYPLYPMGTFVVKTMEDVSPGSSIRLMYEMDANEPGTTRFKSAFKHATGMSLEEFDGVLIQKLQEEFEPYRDLDKLGNGLTTGRLLGAHEDVFLTGLTNNQHNNLYINTVDENGNLHKKLVASDNQLHMDSLHYLRFGADVNDDTIVFSGMKGFDDVLYVQSYKENKKGGINLGERKVIPIECMKVIRNPVLVNDHEIAFIGSEGEQLDIYKIDINNGNLVQLTDTREGEKFLDYSDEFDSFLFTREDMTLHEGTNSRPEWSFQTHMYEMLDGAVVRVTDNNFNELVAQYSPSSHQIVFVADHGNDYNLYLVDETGKTVQLSEEPIAALNPFFTDDTHIKFNDVKNLSLRVKETKIKPMQGERQLLEAMLFTDLVGEKFEYKNSTYVTESFVPILRDDMSIEGVILEATDNKGNRILVQDIDGKIISLEEKEPELDLPNIGYDEFKRAVSPSGEYMVSMHAQFIKKHSEKNNIEFKVTDLQTGEETILPPLPGLKNWGKISNLTFLDDKHVMISKPYNNTVVFVETGEEFPLSEYMDADPFDLTGVQDVWHVKDSNKSVLITTGMNGYNAIVYDRETGKSNTIMQDNLRFGMQQHDSTFSLWTSGDGKLSIYKYNMKEDNLDSEEYDLGNQMEVNWVEFNNDFIVYESENVAKNKKRVEVIERNNDESKCVVHKLEATNLENVFFNGNSIVIDTGDGFELFKNGESFSSISISDIRQRQERKSIEVVIDDIAQNENLEHSDLLLTEPRPMELAPGLGYMMVSLSNNGAMGFVQLKNRTLSRDLLFAGIFSQNSGFLYTKYQDHEDQWAAEVSGRAYGDEHRIRGILIKPFVPNRFTRFEGFGGYEFETKYPNYTPAHNLIVGGRMGIDSSLYNETGPQQGTSLFLSAEAGLNLATGVDHLNLNFDARQRLSPHPIFSLFVGAHGGTSQGDDPYTYLNGGSVSIRGHEWASIPGNNYLIGSAEARLHLWDLLIAVWKEPLRNFTYYTMAMGGMGVYYDAGIVGNNGENPNFYHSFGVTGDFLTPIGNLGFWANIAGGEKSFGLNLWGKK